MFARALCVTVRAVGNDQPPADFFFDGLFQVFGLLRGVPMYRVGLCLALLPATASLSVAVSQQGCASRPRLRSHAITASLADEPGALPRARLALLGTSALWSTYPTFAKLIFAADGVAPRPREEPVQLHRVPNVQVRAFRRRQDMVGRPKHLALQSAQLRPVFGALKVRPPFGLRSA